MCLCSHNVVKADILTVCLHGQCQSSLLTPDACLKVPHSGQRKKDPRLKGRKKLGKKTEPQPLSGLFNEELGKYEKSPCCAFASAMFVGSEMSKPRRKFYQWTSKRFGPRPTRHSIMIFPRTTHQEVLCRVSIRCCQIAREGQTPADAIASNGRSRTKCMDIPSASNLTIESLVQRSGILHSPTGSWYNGTNIFHSPAVRTDNLWRVFQANDYADVMNQEGAKMDHVRLHFFPNFLKPCV